MLSLNTRMGDDHFHLTSTDFTPGLQDINGISIAQWVPVVTMSGPIRKGKMWFIDALDGEYDNNITKQLPPGSDSDHIWRVDNLAKVQSNLTTRNIVTASFLSNYYHDQYAGLSLLQPQPTTPTDVETAYIGSLKRSILFPRWSATTETGFGANQYNASRSLRRVTDASLHPTGPQPRVEPEFRGQLLPAPEHCRAQNAGSRESLPSTPSVARTPRYQVRHRSRPGLNYGARNFYPRASRSLIFSRVSRWLGNCQSRAPRDVNGFLSCRR